MTGKRLHDDRRGASIAVTHALTVGITALLITGLLIGASDMVESQQRTAIRLQLTDIGGSLASEIRALDRLNETGSSVNTTLRTEYPDRVAGVPYQVSINAGPGTSGRPHELHLLTDNPAVLVTFSIENETNIDNDVVSSDSLTVQLCSRSTGTEIKIGRAC